MESGTTGRTSKQKKKTQKSTSKTTKKAATKKKSEEVENKDVPDTSRDFEIAQEMGLGRAAKTPSATETKRQAALAQLRKERTSSKNDDSEDSENYGDNDDESSDDDYTESAHKPWINKKRDESMDGDDDDLTGRNSSKAFVEADISDFVKVTIPRRRLSRWCNEPYFEEAVMNHYVRLAIGRDRTTQKPCYRLCKITGVKTGKEYQFPAYANQKQVRKD